MQIIHVAPIAKIPFPNPQILSYFFEDALEPGIVVEVPLHRRMVPGIVLGNEPLASQKIRIKRASYQLRHLTRVVTTTSLLDRKELELAQWLSQYYWSPLGLVLKTMLPNYLFRKKDGFVIVTKRERGQSPLVGTVPAKKRPLLIWGEERFTLYAHSLRQILKKRQQVLFLVPEIDHISHYVPLLQKLSGGAKDVAMLSGSLSEKRYFEEWLRFRDGTAKILIGTRSAVFAGTRNLGLIIVDEEEHENHISWEQHPRYSARDVAKKRAELEGIPLILGTLAPSVESYHAAQNRTYHLEKPSPIKKHTSLNITVTDMRRELRDGNYSILGQNLQDALTLLTKTNGRALLFINRRGFASFILCRECGFILMCDRCERPLTYHQHTKEKNEGDAPLLLCHHCGKEARAPNVCPNCSGIKIRYVGAGTERLEVEVRRIIPDAHIFRIDSDTISTREDLTRALKKFKEGEINILVGTQLLVKEHLLPPVDLVGVISIDLILNFPDYRSHERVVRIIERIKKLTSGNLILQTYNPEYYRYLTGDISTFYGGELEKRKTYGWPPFSQLIKLTFSHQDPSRTKNEATALLERLKTGLRYLQKKHQFPEELFTILGPAPGFTPKIKGNYIYHILIKFLVRDLQFEDMDLELRNGLLEIVPNSWTVDVDPVEVV